jgi:hypothetical protein
MLDIDLTVRTNDPVSVGIDPLEQGGVTLGKFFEVSMVDNRRDLRWRHFIHLYAILTGQGTVNDDDRLRVLIFIDIRRAVP